jgi:hypothetical protein
MAAHFFFGGKVAPFLAIVVGTDYEKVETLVANQFEAIAIKEKENRNGCAGGFDAKPLRVEYARNYLRKIVNIRINLQAPDANHFKELLARDPASRKPGRRGMERTFAATPWRLPPCWC